MAKTRQQKEKIVNSYIQKLKDSDALLVITPKGVTVNEMTSLKKALGEINPNITINVVKNTLFKIALEKTQTELGDITLDKENAVVFCQDGASESAKILYEFIENTKKGEVKGGLLKDTPLNSANIKELAELPPKDVLIAITVKTIAAPLSNFMNVLNGNTINLINVLKNISESR